MDSYDKLCKAFIRPPRKQYDPMAMGPPDFMLGSFPVRRTDFQIRNRKGLNLFGSLYEPGQPMGPPTCLIYCHGNAGCRLDGFPAVEHLVPLGISVCCFDFSGCGMSEGEYITLGFKERDDLEDVYNYITGWKHFATMGVWGRSMGAATTLFFAAKQKPLSCIILDSPFANLNDLAVSFGKQKASLVPTFLIKGALIFIKDSIQSRTGADIDKLNPIEDVPNLRMPAMFGVADDDNLTPPKDVNALHQKYGGDRKYLIHMKGTHYGDRTEEWFGPVVSFIRDHIFVPPKPYGTPKNLSATLPTPTLQPHPKSEPGGHHNDLFVPLAGQQQPGTPSRLTPTNQQPSPNVSPRGAQPGERPRSPSYGGTGPAPAPYPVARPITPTDSPRNVMESPRGSGNNTPTRPRHGGIFDDIPKPRRDSAHNVEIKVSGPTEESKGSPGSLQVDTTRPRSPTDNYQPHSPSQFKPQTQTLAPGQLDGAKPNSKPQSPANLTPTTAAMPRPATPTSPSQLPPAPYPVAPYRPPEKHSIQDPNFGKFTYHADDDLHEFFDLDHSIPHKHERIFGEVKQ